MTMLCQSLRAAGETHHAAWTRFEAVEELTIGGSECLLTLQKDKEDDVAQQIQAVVATLEFHDHSNQVSLIEGVFDVKDASRLRGCHRDVRIPEMLAITSIVQVYDGHIESTPVSDWAALRNASNINTFGDMEEFLSQDAECPGKGTAYVWTHVAVEGGG